MVIGNVRGILFLCFQLRVVKLNLCRSCMQLYVCVCVCGHACKFVCMYVCMQHYACTCNMYACVCVHLYVCGVCVVHRPSYTHVL